MTLFDIPETLSPQAAWMQRNNIHTSRPTDETTAEAIDAEGLPHWDPQQWLAWQSQSSNPPSPHETASAAQGGTKVEALLILANKLKIDFYV